MHLKDLGDCFDIVAGDRERLADAFCRQRGDPGPLRSSQSGREVVVLSLRGAEHERARQHSARLAFRDCAALSEGDSHSWFAGLDESAHPALDAIAAAVNPHARCHPVAKPNDARLAWEVVIEPSSRPREPPSELALAKLSRGADFRFEQRRTLRV